uniref:Actin related protein 10 n=1 Tax=Plectus sambesii TaxID=2011161 RepID=A0A914W935_9BILA
MPPPRFDSTLGIVTDKASVIIEVGTAYTKCGYAAELTPRAIVPSHFFDAEGSLKTLKLFDKDMSPDQRSLVLTRFLRQMYYKHLLAVPKERRVVVVESVLTPSEHRDLIARALFENLDVPSILFAPSHLLACFPFGTQNALVIDVGHKESVVIPVFEGVAMLNSWEASPVGTSAVHSKLRELLLAKASFDTAGQGVVPAKGFAEVFTDELLEDICVRFCFVTNLERGRLIQAAAQDTTNSVKTAPPPPDVRLPLNNEKTLLIPGLVREAAAEVLFEHDEDSKSLPQLVLDSILRCPLDLRRPLCEHLLVVGGGSLMTGFLARLKAELLDLLATKYQEKLPLTSVKFFQYAQSPIEVYASWLGASENRNETWYSANGTQEPRWPERNCDAGRSSYVGDGDGDAAPDGEVG